MARKAGVLQRSCSTSCESSTQDARERCSELTGGTRISTASLLLNCWTGYSFVQSIHTSPDGSYGGQDMSAEWITSDYPGRCLHPGFQRSVRSAALTSLRILNKALAKAHIAKATWTMLASQRDVWRNILRSLKWLYLFIFVTFIPSYSAETLIYFRPIPYAREGACMYVLREN